MIMASIAAAGNAAEVRWLQEIADLFNLEYEHLKN
jgi:hypothetical protein